MTPMLRFLFPTLTAQPKRGAELFAAVSGRAREPHWFIAGEVPDTLDGRFRMLATLAALVAVRLESAGEPGEAASVALTERFIEVMEAEHREMGFGDPNLGRKVRALVGALGQRVGLWRSAVAGEQPWTEAVRRSVYGGEGTPAGAVHTGEALRAFWSALKDAHLADLTAGRLP